MLRYLYSLIFLLIVVIAQDTQLQEVEAPRISRHLAHECCTGRLYPPRDTPATHFFKMLSRPKGRGAAGGIKSMKGTHAPIGNRTRDLRIIAQCLNQMRHPHTASKIQYKECIALLGVSIFKNLHMKTTRKCEILQPKMPISVSNLACNLLKVYVAWCRRNSP